MADTRLFGQGEVVANFQDLEDPRPEVNRKHPLVSVMVVAFIAVLAGLNKGETRNALARAVFFNRLGEMHDKSLENQRYPASGLNLVTAAIVLWNTAYLERAIQAIKDHGQSVDQALLQHFSPLSREHINRNRSHPDLDLAFSPAR